MVPILQVHQKLDEEARLRLEVVAELKDEKRKRWGLEDTLQKEQSASRKLQQVNSAVQPNYGCLLWHNVYIGRRCVDS